MWDNPWRPAPGKIVCFWKAPFSVPEPVIKARSTACTPQASQLYLSPLVDSTFHPPLLPLFSFSFSPDSLLLSLSLPSFFSIFNEIQILWKIFSTQNLLLVNISRAFLQRGLFFAKLNRYVTPILNSFIIDIFVVIHICIPFSSWVLYS